MTKVQDGCHVLLLKGGVSSEREVSLATGAACAGALDTLGYRYTELDFDGSVSRLVRALEQGVDVILNCLHGTYGEDGRVQAVADLMHIPYTHSGVCASALAMHKARSVDIFRAHGLDVPQGLLLDKTAIAGLSDWPMALPIVAKPVAEGSSVGVQIIAENQHFLNHRATLLELAQTGEVLFEEYIPGRELTVAVVEDARALVALGVTELEVTAGLFYDYRAKYSKQGGARHLCPAPIPENLAEFLKKQAIIAHRALGLRGVSRSDFRYDPGQERCVILEINTQPGMTETSLLPEQAALYGWDFATLVQQILRAARYD